MLRLEGEDEAEDHVGGGVGVVVHPQHGGGDGALVDVPLQAGDGEGAIEAAVEAESVPGRGRGGRSGEDVRTRGDGYHGEDLCPGDGVEVRELVAHLAPVDALTGQSHGVELDSG